MNSITFDSNGYAGISVFGHKTVSRGNMTVLLKTGETCATFTGLSQLKKAERVAELRGKTVQEILG